VNVETRRERAAHPPRGYFATEASLEKSRRARGGGTPRRAANASKKNQRVNRASFKRRDGRRAPRASFKRRDGRRAPRAATTRGVDRSRARAVGKPCVRFRIQIQSPTSDAFDATRARAER